MQVTISAGGQLSTASTTLLFTPTNWFIPQTVTVSAIDDSTSEEITLGRSAAPAAAPNETLYNGVAFRAVNVAINDNDNDLASTASFVGTDASTQGAWKGTYGSDGFVLAQDTSGGNPAHPVLCHGHAAGPVGLHLGREHHGPGGLVKSTGTATDRLAATWFAPSTFDIDVRLNDLNTHQIAVYALDWQDAHAERDDPVDRPCFGHRAGHPVDHQLRQRRVPGLEREGPRDHPGDQDRRAQCRAQRPVLRSGGGSRRARLTWRPTRRRRGPGRGPTAATVITWPRTRAAATPSSLLCLGDSPRPEQLHLGRNTGQSAGAAEIDRRTRRSPGRHLVRGQPRSRSTSGSTTGKPIKLPSTPSTGRTARAAQTIQLFDTVSGVQLDSRSIANFSNGVYLVWNASGRVTIKVTRNAGSNAVLSGLFFDPEVPAFFVKTDITTHGSWKSQYGGDGHNLAQDTSGGNPILPAYASVAFKGTTDYTWAASTTDAAALEKSTGGSTDRLAATWYADNSFEIDVRFDDANSHQIALYALDWHDGSRARRSNCSTPTPAPCSTPGRSPTSGTVCTWSGTCPRASRSR